jgi:hypothetical protein
VFENKELRRIFGPETVEITRKKELHNETIHNLHPSPNTITVKRGMRWAEMQHTHGEMRNAYRILLRNLKAGNSLKT